MSKSVIVYGVKSPYLKTGEAYEVSEAVAKKLIESGAVSYDKNAVEPKKAQPKK